MLKPFESLSTARKLYQNCTPLAILATITAIFRFSMLGQVMALDPPNNIAAIPQLNQKPGLQPGVNSGPRNCCSILELTKKSISSTVINELGVF